MYNIFIECNGVSNLLSSEILFHYIGCLLYINVTNSSHCFAGEITGYTRFICYI